MRVSLIITTYNRPDALNLVLKSVNSQSKQPDEIIIADDGSGNTTKSCIEDFKKKSSLKVIHSWQEDRGFRVARSRNKAIAKTNFEYIILIDGDVMLHKKFIEDHLKHAQSGFFVQGTRVLLSQNTSKILISKKKNLSFFLTGLKNRKNAIYSTVLSKIFLKNKNSLHNIKTCNFAFFKADCLKVNGFNNEIEGWGREDSEFVARMMNRGVCRKNVRFNMIQFHLWHPLSSRATLKKNDLILKETINNKINWCENGINHYL